MTNWGVTAILGTDTTGTWCRAMGGTSPNTADMRLYACVFYIGNIHTAQLRLGVYQGGALDDPSGATLIYDFGQTSGVGTTEWAQLDVAGLLPSLAANVPTWIAIKMATGISVRYSNQVGDAGDFQTVRGRYLSSVISSNPAFSFPSTWPADSGSFGSFWYSVYLIYIAQYKLEGVTKDKDGATLATCECFLFKDNQDNTLTYLGYDQSDGSGNYSLVGVPDNDARYIVVAFKDNTPHVFDVSDHVLQPEV